MATNDVAFNKWWRENIREFKRNKFCKIEIARKAWEAAHNLSVNHVLDLSDRIEANLNKEAKSFNKLQD